MSSQTLVYGGRENGERGREVAGIMHYSECSVGLIDKPRRCTGEDQSIVQCAAVPTGLPSHWCHLPSGSEGYEASAPPLCLSFLPLWQTPTLTHITQLMTQGPSFTSHRWGGVQTEEGEAMKTDKGMKKELEKENWGGKGDWGKQKARQNQRKSKCKCRKIKEGHLEISHFFSSFQVKWIKDYANVC